MTRSLPAVIVIAKAPRPGRVKTRLCPPCSAHEAARLAAAALADTLAVVAATPARRRILALNGDGVPVLPGGFEVVPQRGGGLAARLATAFEDVGDPAVLIGMDTPQLRPALLAHAGAALLAPGVDSVLGPAHDGGWWAIGLDAPDPDVFRGVPMSTPVTGAAQLASLRGRGDRVHLLPVLRDVDTFEDARAVARAHPGTRFAGALAGIHPARPAGIGQARADGAP